MAQFGDPRLPDGDEMSRQGADGKMNATALVRFERKTRRTESGCLLWTGSLHSTGHGQFGIWRGDEKRRGCGIAHRVAWEHANGPIPAGVRIYRICENQSCVELAHLKAITPKEKAEKQNGSPGCMIAKQDANGKLNDIALARFDSRCKRAESGCLEWTHARTERGYGIFRMTKKYRDLPKYTFFVHRIAYEHKFGPIPAGLVIDHLCRNHCCVEPEHLDVVTQAENCRRGEVGKHMSSRTHCNHGHEFTPENTIWQRPKGAKPFRNCRECSRISARKSRGPKKVPSTHCNHGHERTPENTIWTVAQGKKYPRCRECRRITARKSYPKANRPVQKRATETHCANGHEWTPENIGWQWKHGKKYRYCKECSRTSARKRFQNTKERGSARSRNSNSTRPGAAV